MQEEKEQLEESLCQLREQLEINTKEKEQLIKENEEERSKQQMQWEKTQKEFQQQSDGRISSLLGHIDQLQQELEGKQQLLTERDTLV